MENVPALPVLQHPAFHTVPIEFPRYRFQHSSSLNTNPVPTRDERIFPRYHPASLFQSALPGAFIRIDLIQGNGRMAGSLTRFTLSDRSSGRIFNLFTSPAHTDPGFAEGYLSLLFSINAFVAQIISQPLIYSITS
jgi:hypothetical protein